MTAETISYQRETDDWLGYTLNQYNPATATFDTYTGNWSYQIVARGLRPTGTWQPAITLGSQKGIDINSLPAGYHQVFIRIDGQGAYVPVLDPIDLIIQ